MKLKNLMAGYNEDQEKYSLSLPKKYLYEPNPAIMKSGLFGSLSKNTNTSKLHSNSHLYTSENLIKFPGRSFEILILCPITKNT